MKKIITNHWKSILIVILLIVIAILWKQNRNISKNVLISDNLISQAKQVDPIQPKVEEIQKPGGGSIAKQEVIAASNYLPPDVTKALRESYLKDTLIAALQKASGGKDIELKNITRLYGEAQKKLDASNLVNTDLNDKIGVLEWQTPFYHSTVDIAKKTNDTHYNIVADFAQITEESKGFLGIGFLKKKTDYMIGTSPDTSATFSGMVQSRTPIKERKDILNISAELGGRYFLKPFNTLQPFGGLRFTINPDGRWQPSISGQYIFNPLSGKLQPILEARLSLTIFE